MANKINVKLILELKASGLSRNQIAATRHMSKHSVSDVINIAKEKEITYEKVKHLSEDDVYQKDLSYRLEFWRMVVRR